MIENQNRTAGGGHHMLTQVLPPKPRLRPPGGTRKVHKTKSHRLKRLRLNRWILDQIKARHDEAQSKSQWSAKDRPMKNPRKLHCHGENPDDTSLVIDSAITPLKPNSLESKKNGQIVVNDESSETKNGYL